MFDLAENLSKFGFSREDYVSKPGQFAIRGCIMDIFSYSQKNPYRIEFFGDVVETISTFNIADQVTIEELNECSVIGEEYTKEVTISEKESNTSKCTSLALEFVKINLIAFVLGAGSYFFVDPPFVLFTIILFCGLVSYDFFSSKVKNK